MALHQNTVLNRKNDLIKGNTQSFNIFVSDDLGFADIFSDEALTVPISQPFSTDDLGYFKFYAEPGLYTVSIGFFESIDDFDKVRKSYTVQLEASDDLDVGLNVLCNKQLNNRFLERDGSSKLISEYPDLAGTAGYTTNAVVGGIEFDSNFTSTEEVSTISSSNQDITIDNNRIYIPSDSTASPGSFLYSTDNGLTEQYAPSVNASNKFAIAHNNSFIIAAGNSGSISVYNYNNFQYIDTKFVSGGTITHAEFDEQTSTWLVVTQGGDVYVSSDPTQSWILNGEIQGIPSFANYVDKTRDGYIIFSDSINTISFIPSLLDSPTATPVVTAALNLIFKKCSNLQSGKILIATLAGGSNRKLFRSYDGGQTFAEFSANNFNSNTLDDLIHAGNDVWVSITRFSSTVQYTTDFGDNWTTVSYTPDSGAGSGNRLWANQNGDVIASFRSDLTKRSLFLSQTIAPTEFEVSQLNSPSLTDKYFVLAKQSN